MSPAWTAQEVAKAQLRLTDHIQPLEPQRVGGDVHHRSDAAVTVTVARADEALCQPTAKVGGGAQMPIGKPSHVAVELLALGGRQPDLSQEPPANAATQDVRIVELVRFVRPHYTSDGKHRS